MKHCLFGMICAVLLCGSAQAQSDYEFLYGTFIGPNDHFNSSGKRLTDACAIIQQDRANFHRFGIRDPDDGNDPVFASRNMRAQIPALCTMPPAFARQIVNGEARYIGMLVRRNDAGEIVEMRMFLNVG